MQYINYRESRQRGTVDFPLEYHHVTPMHPQYVMSLHWHVEFELIRILSGSFQVTFDEDEFSASKDSFLFIPAGVLHGGIPKDCTYECIVFDMNMLMNKSDSCCKLIHKIIDHEVELKHIYSDSYNDIHQIVWSLFDAAASKRDGYQLVVQGALYQLIGTIFSEGYFDPVPSTPSRSHKKIVQL